MPLHLLDGPEGPADDIRNALQMLLAAERRLEELHLIGAEDVTELLRGAEARLFHALFKLESHL